MGDMSGEQMGVPFPWTDMRLLYLPVSSFFEMSRAPYGGTMPKMTVKTGQTGEVAETTLTARNATRQGYGW